MNIYENLINIVDTILTKVSIGETKYAKTKYGTNAVIYIEEVTKGTKIFEIEEIDESGERKGRSIKIVMLGNEITSYRSVNVFDFDEIQKFIEESKFVNDAEFFG